MKILGTISAMWLFALAMCAQEITPRASLSPAEQRVEHARRWVDRNPSQYQAYNELALALARRARETADPNYYRQAEHALGKSFELAPNNFEGRKLRAWVLLGKHEFAQALEVAQALNREMPDDILVYGFLADAHAELGNYMESEDAAQWMLNMRPGNVPGLTRGAYLRELYGDIEGAIEFMGSAYQRTPPQEREDRAWILTHIAHLELSRGRVDAPAQILQAAFDHYPKYHYALAQMAKVRGAQQEYAEAVELLQQLVQAAPNPENLYPLAEALERAGRREEAQAAFAEFEQKALREVEWADNANRELIFYYADHAGKPAEALRIAQKEFSRRQDVYTLDAYAWALYANGEYAEARQQIERALAVGIRDAKLLYHAGAITSKLKDRLAAQKYLKESLELNPVSEVAAAAQSTLNSLTSASATWIEQEEASGFNSL